MHVKNKHSPVIVTICMPFIEVMGQGSIYSQVCDCVVSPVGFDP